MSSNLPPGVTDRMIEEQAGAFAICDTCGYQADACICPECEACQEVGNPSCYVKSCYGGHDMALNKEQLIGLQVREVDRRKEEVLVAEMSLDWLRGRDAADCTLGPFDSLENFPWD